MRHASPRICLSSRVAFAMFDLVVRLTYGILRANAGVSRAGAALAIVCFSWRTPKSTNRNPRFTSCEIQYQRESQSRGAAVGFPRNVTALPVEFEE